MGRRGGGDHHGRRPFPFGLALRPPVAGWPRAGVALGRLVAGGPLLTPGLLLALGWVVTVGG